jgi:hypothetical protein
MAGLFYTVHDQGNGEGSSMMNMQIEGREVIITLRDDVWQLTEPGTLCLTRTQAQLIRQGLNSLDYYHSLDDEPEDG